MGKASKGPRSSSRSSARTPFWQSSTFAWSIAIAEFAVILFLLLDNSAEFDAVTVPTSASVSGTSKGTWLKSGSKQVEDRAATKHRMPQTPPGIHMQLQRANELMSTGNTPGAKKIVFDQLLRSADSRNEPEVIHFGGLLMIQSGAFDKALELFLRAHELAPNDFRNHHYIGVSYMAMEKLEDARKWLEAATGELQASAELFYNYGLCLQRLGELTLAADAYKKAVSVSSANPQFRQQLGNVLQRSMRWDEAEAVYETQFKEHPGHGKSKFDYGQMLQVLRRYDEALRQYASAADLAATSRPVDVVTLTSSLNNIGSIYKERNQYKSAIKAFEEAMQSDPNFEPALRNAADAYTELKDHEKAASYYEKLIDLKPEDSASKVTLYGSYLHMGALDPAAKLREQMIEDVSKLEVKWAFEQPVYKSGAKDGLDSFEYDVSPYMLMHANVSATMERSAAEWHYVDTKRRRATWMKEKFTALNMVPTTHDFPHRDDGKLRIAYISADFRRHPVTHQLIGVLQNHDKSKYEIYCYAIGPVADTSQYRRQVQRACTYFFANTEYDAVEWIAKIQEDEIDIAVDLMGYTSHSIWEMYSTHPFPVQVGYLGYPGTSGSDVMDYYIADRIVIPDEDSKTAWSETVLYLPNSYMPASTSILKELPDTPSRSEAGLPEDDDVFVFVSFSQTLKIDEVVFDTWMRILKRVPNSVLWLLQEDYGHLDVTYRALAEKSGVSSDRLLFAERMSYEEHLSRHRLADIFLDTFTYTAHTSGADSVLCGVPMVTLKGRTMAQRVGSSLMSAAGLPEFIAKSVDEYVEIAVRYATDKEALASVKMHLSPSRLDSLPLFASEKYTRDIESLYDTIYRERSASRA